MVVMLGKRMHPIVHSQSINLSHEFLSCRIVKDVDLALQLSQIYEVPVREIGHAWLLFIFSIVIRLIDSTLNDWGLQMTYLDGPSLEFEGADHHDMDIDSKESQNSERNEKRKQIQKMNSFMAMEVLGKLMESKKAMVLLRLVRLNMYVHPCLSYCCLPFFFYLSLILPKVDPASLDIFSSFFLYGGYTVNLTKSCFK